MSARSRLTGTVYTGSTETRPLSQQSFHRHNNTSSGVSRPPATVPPKDIDCLLHRGTLPPPDVVDGSRSHRPPRLRCPTLPPPIRSRRPYTSGVRLSCLRSGAAAPATPSRGTTVCPRRSTPGGTSAGPGRCLFCGGTYGSSVGPGLPRCRPDGVAGKGKPNTCVYSRFYCFCHFVLPLSNFHCWYVYGPGNKDVRSVMVVVPV